ncbi:MAG: hypothetical protein R3F43_17960 [bacterium]
MAGLLDDAVLRVEQAFVTLAALVMTATVTLDIIFVPSPPKRARWRASS